jgi:hypothetical protein
MTDIPAKKSGKAEMVGPPLDPNEDFDAPVRKEPEQQTLPGVEAKEADTPKPVRNKKMLANFVQAILFRDTDDAPMLKFEFSFPVTPEHEEYLPEEVWDAWKIVKRGHCKRYDVLAVPHQTITIAQVPDDKDDLRIVGCQIDRPSLQVIEESGQGKNKVGIRFSFRAILERDKDSTRFAIAHDGEDVWITMRETQGTLLKDKAKDD